MKLLLFFLLAAAAVYGVVYYIPADTRHTALTSLGLDTFFSKTLPDFLHEKLSIPRSPVATRKELLDQLSGTIVKVQEKLDAIVPPTADGTRTPLDKIATKSEVRDAVAATQELLTETMKQVDALNAANSDQSVVKTAANRVLDNVLPPIPAATGANCPAK